MNKWTFIPDPVTVTMTSTLGETNTGELGDTFAFRSPTTGLGAFDVNATYNVSGKLVSQFGVVLQLGWSWDALKAEFKAPGLELEASLIPASFKETNPLWTSDPLLMPNGFEASVGNLGSYNATYTLHYDEEFVSTNQGAYNTTIGTPFDDYLSDEGTAEVYFGYAGNDKIYANSGNDTIDAGSGNDLIKGGSGDDSINAGDGSDTVDGGSGNDTIAVLANWGETDVVSGGTGTDSLSIDFSANSGAPLYWNILHAVKFSVF